MTDTTTLVPKRAGLVLTALILSALVCNINLAAANITLPSVGTAFGASQTQLNLVAVGCALGLAMSVLYLGAIADRYGRKQLLTLGLVLTVIASCLSAWAPSVEILIAARVFTGIAAGMAYPTTLSLITALWGNGPKRTLAIALWSSVSATATVLGSIVAGLLLDSFWWGSAFLVAVPLAIIAAVMVLLFVPSHVAESDDPVDHLGGVLATLLIGALVLGISTVFAPGTTTLGIGLLVIAAVLLALFGKRQSTIKFPLYSLGVAKRRLFWVPATCGLIVFGSLMGAMFVGQQFMQNILGYSTVDAALAVVPLAIGLLIVAQFSARMITLHGSRFTMISGYILVFLGFLTMVFWGESTPYWYLGLGYALIGCGAGFAMTPASRSITQSTPVRRVGMASATADLQRDLGGSIMQSLLGAILATGFAGSFAKLIADSSDAAQISDATTAALQSSYASAMNVASQNPQYADAITQAASESFVSGATWAYVVGAIAIVGGAALAAFMLPKQDAEIALLASYEAEDAAKASSSPST
ncbi:MFS transporter [Demequina aurantiaca]|uniref:MFS transporter n=1 Tax=Demequina aurantiaca TaxID=676200 RepID=UPI000781EE76|nr:MFS transporter [Demequina aurantiaca]